MNLSELTLPMKSGAMKRLTDAGYEKLGSGQTGDVFKKPGSNYVLKLFTADDDPYLAFVKLAQENPNPHFPKFVGKLIRVTSGYYAIRMEQLTHDANPNHIKLVEWYVDKRAEFGYASDEKMTANNKLLIQTMNEVNKMFEEQPRLREACDLIAYELIRGDGFYSDLHKGNIMSRGSTLVISDPVSF